MIFSTSGIYSWRLPKRISERKIHYKAALEKVVRDSNIDIKRDIFNKSIQLLAFADDIDIIARTPTTLTEDFLSLEKEVLRMELKF
ncbi:hypothetical protein TNCV_295821 [Trichonephila clavipes]|nr:hypothetical protein TNCV_295821 [Trichonephila clavipes]